MALNGNHEKKRKIGDSRQSIAEVRKNLPVYKFKAQICEKVVNNDVVLVMAETGSGLYRECLVFHTISVEYLSYPSFLYVAFTSGKSTQIPQYLLEMPSLRKLSAHSLCVTQPRRVAAVTVAKRVAQERNCRLGTEVGYRVRFDDKTNFGTKLVYATDGMLLRQAMLDPLLSAYSVILLDEAHERSLQTDVLVS